MMWKWKRPAAFLLAAAMIFTMPGVPASAVEAGASAVHTGLCEHHPEHTEDCGYTEGTEGAACEHEHTEDCYTLVEKCIREHDESCYPVLEGSVLENTATPSEAEKTQPTACTHECSEESGCKTKKLSCRHERGEHDDSCGYIPATEGTPCGYTCELCNSQDSGLVPGVSGNAPAECICENHCEQEAVNPDCPVCSAEDADLSACKGTEQAMSLMAAAADDETISGNVTWENRNITTPVVVKDDTTITLKGENSIYQPATETTDKYDIDDDGTKDTVYEISNAGQLYWFAGLVNGTLDGVEQNTLANAVLTANITVNENLLDSLQYDTEGNVSNGSDFISWTPIADWMGNRTTQYSGTFDGNNKTVSGLYFNGDSTCIGLFGSSESDGNIKNVGVVDSYFKGNDHVGGVCGNNAGTITNCYNAGNLTAIESSATIGGICGYNNGGTIANCYNTGTVTATGTVASVGGVCGCSTELILNCYNIGTVTAASSDADISGICGYNFGPIKNCYYLADTEDENGGKTTEQFASGEVAYLLSQGCSTGVGDDAETYDGSIWGQKLGENGDTYPVLDITKRVYQVDKYDGCEGKPGSSTKVYSNQSTSIYGEHSFAYEPVENGNAIKAACSECGATYTVKLTQPAATSDEKIVYDGTEKKAGTAIAIAVSYTHLTLPTKLEV